MRFAKNWTAMVKFAGALGSGTETYAGNGRLTCNW
jgi:hypothetical protein